MTSPRQVAVTPARSQAHCIFSTSLCLQSQCSASAKAYKTLRDGELRLSAGLLFRLAGDARCSGAHVLLQHDGWHILCKFLTSRSFRMLVLAPVVR